MSQDLDKLSSEIAALRAQVSQLTIELMQLRGERGAALPFDFAQGDSGVLAGRIEQASRVLTLAASFWPTISADESEITLEPGDVVLGPGTWALEFSETTPAVSSTNTHVWLEINVKTGETTMEVGSKTDMKAACADSQDTIAYPLIETVWSAGKITKARRLLDAIIPRAGG